MREDDPREARDLLAYARPEQIRVVLDFGLWSGDQLVPERLEEWVDIIAEMPFETVGSWIQGLDTELIGLLIRKGARIYDLSMEDPPDEPEGTFYATPDRLFVLDVVGYRPRPEPQFDEAEPPAAAEEQTPSASALIRVIDSLYRADMTFCRRILVAAKAELDSELEEMALRWRQGRMADLGFIDAIEALEIYRELDPQSVRIGELRPGTRMRPHFADGVGQGGEGEGEEGPADLLRAPAILGEHMAGSSLFARALGRVTSPAEIEELHFALVALANRVLAADRVDAADNERVAAGMGRMRATLDLAVEFLARAGGNTVDEDRAVDAVRTIPAIRLFRLGVSLIGKVRALGQALLRRGPFAGLQHLDLVEEPEASVLAAASRPRALYASVLDVPPAAGERPFESLADIARATAAIQRAAVAQAMLLGLGVKPEHLLPEALLGVEPRDANAIDTGLLARTALLLVLSRQRPSGVGADEAAPRRPAPAGSGFRALTPAEVASFASPGKLDSFRVFGAPGQPTRTASRARREGVGRSSQREVPTRPDPGLLDEARRILRDVVPKAFEVPGREIAERWLETLSPLAPVLTAAAPSPSPSPAARGAEPRGAKRTPAPRGPLPTDP